MTRFFLLTICLFSFISSVSAQDVREVTATLLNVRKGPGTGHAVIGQLKAGDQVEIVGQAGNWYEFKNQQLNGFAYGKYLKQIEIIPDPAPEIVRPDQEWEAITLENGDLSGCLEVDRLYDKKLENFLRIVVSDSTDVIVKLMNFYTGKCARAVFIKGGTTYSIENIPEGQYFLKIAYGKELGQVVEDNVCKLRFRKNVIYEKGEEILNYNLRRNTNGYEVPSYELFLDVTNPHTGKHFDAQKIDEAAFNN